MVAFRTGSDPFEISDPGSKVKIHTHCDVIFIFSSNSLLTSLLCISALLRPIEMKFDTSLKHAFGRIVFKFHKNQTDDDVIVTSLKFSPNNCSYLKFY